VCPCLHPSLTFLFAWVARPSPTPLAAPFERIISAVAASGVADVLVIHVNMTVILGFRHVDMLGNIIKAALRVRETDRTGMHIALVLRSDGDAETEERKRDYRLRAIESGVPVYDELAQAAKGLSALRVVEAFRARISPPNSSTRA